MNKTLAIIALIAVVNALGYGIIIPILYSYSQRFGLTDFQNGLLFSLFSIFQFLSTPFIGRLSDKYGRKPLLIASIAGTAISFLIMAFAPSAVFLFIARALDGITAGNIPVASAVISDTTDVKNRAKGFGIIGASFSFGFIFGPAISALTVGISPSMPFIIAACVSLIAVVLTAVVLPETNRHVGREVAKAKLFDWSHLLEALVNPNVGTTLVLMFIYSLAFSLFIYGFQPFAVKILNLSATQISTIFAVTGVIGLIAQTLVIPRVVKRVGDKRALTGALITVSGTFVAFACTRSIGAFISVAMLNSLANSFIAPLIQTLLSKEADGKSQGSILGISSSYQSIGMIVGPVIGGSIASIAIPLPFVVGSIVNLIGVFLSVAILKKPLSEQAKLHAMN